MIPGEYFVNADETIIGNEGREAVSIDIVNTGDRPIQVGSHFHFAEVNDSVEFDREAARGKRLDIPSGTAVRLEPGDKRSVNLVDFGGAREVHGFNDQVNGPIN
ncbi:urease subunit beta [Corynebacterium maris DSM 45190]|uniref:Urease subunit beta n=1 Tax=Corynebacterium maris DSM 45190 TaxID=1224163 RepID=S5SXC7_9CORY|nr:urease subunit beta [Corynebacterium maris]AGS35787.1 urease subunit beta [Corynebacterium maris DSM 45190]